MPCGDEKRVKENLAKSLECSDCYENENATHALVEITLKFYCSTILAYVMLSNFFALGALRLCFAHAFGSIMQDAMAK